MPGRHGAKHADEQNQMGLTHFRLLDLFGNEAEAPVNAQSFGTALTAEQAFFVGIDADNFHQIKQFWLLPHRVDGIQRKGRAHIENDEFLMRGQIHPPAFGHNDAGQAINNGLQP